MKTNVDRLIHLSSPATPLPFPPAVQINGEDLAQASHETVVDCIRRSGNLVTLTICSAVQTVNQSVSEYALAGPATNRQCSTLPRKLPGEIDRHTFHFFSHFLFCFLSFFLFVVTSRCDIYV